MGSNPSSPNPAFTVVMARKENEVDGIYNYAYRLSNALSLVDRSEVIGPHDKELIKGFIRHLEAKRVSTGRLAKYAYTLKVLTEHLGTEVNAASRKDIERLSIWIQSQGYEPHTVSDYVFAWKYFFKFAHYGNTDKETPFPEEVRWLKATQKNNERKEPEFFTPEDAEALIRAADALRDKCMLSIAFERGMRPAELLLLNEGYVTLEGYEPSPSPEVRGAVANMYFDRKDRMRLRAYPKNRPDDQSVLIR